MLLIIAQKQRKGESLSDNAHIEVKKKLILMLMCGCSSKHDISESSKYA